MKQKPNIVKHEFRSDWGYVGIVDIHFKKPRHRQLPVQHDKYSQNKRISMRCVRKKK